MYFTSCPFACGSKGELSNVKFHAGTLVFSRPRKCSQNAIVRKMEIESMRAGIQEETLRAMLEAGAVREVLVSRHAEKWGLAIRLGGAGSRWLPVRSRREALRTWASLTAVGRFAEALGIKGFSVEL